MKRFFQSRPLRLLLPAAMIFTLFLPGCTKKEVVEEWPGDAYTLGKGVNISHWLSQSRRRGEERRTFITEEDVKFIASIGYDHIRLPIDEEQMWDSLGNKEAEAFQLMHNAIEWARSNKLRILIDLHILRSHHFNEAEKPLWTQPEAQERFFQCWRELSEELSRYPRGLVGYELMNEPVADDPEEWNVLVEKATAAVREKEPNRVIVIGSNRWQSADTFDDLRVPANDPNIILSFHFYTPFLLTHHQAGWTSIGDYTGPVHYPGMSVEEADIEGLPEELANSVRGANGVFNRDTLEALMEKPIRKSKELGLPLYCGEFGCLPTVPREDMLQWYADMRWCFEKHNIGWANWDYKGGFGIVERNQPGLVPIQDLIDVLLGEKPAQ